MNSLQKRIMNGTPERRRVKANSVLGEVRAALTKAYNEDKLATPMHGIWDVVRIVSPPEGAPVNAVAIVGGTKSYDRAPEDAELSRTDGAWFHFSMTLLDHHDGTLEVLAYVFEIVSHTWKPLFLRFDLNLEGHHNDERGIRSHLHPGHEDILLPSPVLDPLEALELMLSIKPLRET